VPVTTPGGGLRVNHPPPTIQSGESQWLAVAAFDDPRAIGIVERAHAKNQAAAPRQVSGPLAFRY